MKPESLRVNNLEEDSISPPPRHAFVSFPGWRHAMAIEHAERMAAEMASFWRDAGLEGGGGGGAAHVTRRQATRAPAVVVGEGSGRIKRMIPNAARKPAAIFARAKSGKGSKKR